MPVLVDDHITILRVVNATATERDRLAEGRVLGVVHAICIGDGALGAVGDAVGRRVRVGEPEGLDVLLGAVDLEVGLECLETAVRARDPLPMQVPLARLLLTLAAQRVYPAPA